MELQKDTQVYYVRTKYLDFSRELVVYKFMQCNVVAFTKNKIKLRSGDDYYLVKKSEYTDIASFNLHTHSLLLANSASKKFIEELLKTAEDKQVTKNKVLEERRERFRHKHEKALSRFSAEMGPLTNVYFLSEKVRTHTFIKKEKDFAAVFHTVVFDKSEGDDKYCEASITVHTTESSGNSMRNVRPDYVFLPDDCDPQELLLNTVAQAYCETFKEQQT